MSLQMMQRFSVGLVAIDFMPSRGADMIQRVRAYGVRYLEVFNGLNYEGEEELNRLKDLANAAGIELSNVGSAARLNTDPSVQWRIVESVRHAAMVGAPYSLLQFGGNASRSDEESLARFTADLQPCLEEAARYGVTLLMENGVPRPGMAPELNETVDGTLRILARVNSPYFGLVLDPANYLMCGEEGFPYSYEVLRPYTRIIHLKDAVRYAPGLSWRVEQPVTHLSGRKWTTVPLGQGALNIRGLVERMIQDGWDGVASLEVLNPGQTDICLQESFGWLAELGVHVALPGDIAWQRGAKPKAPSC